MKNYNLFKETMKEFKEGVNKHKGIGIRSIDISPSFTPLVGVLPALFNARKIVIIRELTRERINNSFLTFQQKNEFHSEVERKSEGALIEIFNKCFNKYGENLSQTHLRMMLPYFNDLNIPLQNRYIDLIGNLEDTIKKVKLLLGVLHMISNSFKRDNNILQKVDDLVNKTLFSLKVKTELKKFSPSKYIYRKIINKLEEEYKKEGALLIDFAYERIEQWKEANQKN